MGLRIAVEWRERKRWRATTSRHHDDVRVYYGYESLPTSQEIASGGVVKTQDLQTRFPNIPGNPNLLYLISSALPPYALRIAQRAQAAGARVVLNQNGVAYPGWDSGNWETTNRFMREVLQQADYVIYQSRFCKLGADRFLSKRDLNCEILYNPVNTEYFRPGKPRSPADPWRLLLAGSHHHFYRVQTAVNTAKFLRDAGVDVRLEIAGRYCWMDKSSNADLQLRDYIRDIGIEKAVTLSGPYTQHDAASLLNRSDILLHTKYNDPCPRLVVEALASGLPIVYSASGGTPELVGDLAGVGIEAPLDWEHDHPPLPSHLADAVIGLIPNYDAFSQEARRRAIELFDRTPWINRHEHVFRELLT